MGEGKQDRKKGVKKKSIIILAVLGGGVGQYELQ